MISAAPTASMRQLIYVSDGYPTLSQTFTRLEARRLLALGLPVVVASLHRPGPLDPGLDPQEDPPVVYLPFPLAPRVAAALIAWLLRRPLVVARLAAHVAFHRTEPFLAGAHLRAPLHLLWGCWLARRVERTSHLHAQFSGAACTVAWVASRLLRSTFSFTAHSEWGFPLIAQKLRDADLVVAVSEHERGRLLARGRGMDGAKVVVSHLGVDPAAWVRDGGVGAPVPRGAPPRLLAVGTLGPTKGHEVLLQACALLRDRGVAFHLDVAGGGPRRSELEAMRTRLDLTDRVTLLGPVPHARVRELVLAAEACVLACRETGDGDVDGIPIVLMESMAAGKATISTAISAIPELIEDGVSGRLVPPDRADALADALAEVLADGGLRGRLGRAARARIVERFDAARSAGRLAGLLRPLLAGGRAA
jgi:glycosyltransferase involved in cell wall biosynthesis